MSAERPIAEDDLQAFIDGRLDASRLKIVEAYLAAHPDVARPVASQKMLRSDLRAALAPYAADPIPPSLNLANMIAARRRPRFAGWQTIAASLCFLAVGGGGGWLIRGAEELPTGGLAALAHEAVVSYQVFAPDQGRPVEIRADEQDRLTAWIGKRIHRAVRIPDLTKSGYRFMGGRVVATPHGPAGLYMYDDDKGTRLVLLQRPMSEEVSAPMTKDTVGSVGGFSWASGGLGYSLVGPEAAPNLHPIADEVRRQLSESI